MIYDLKVLSKLAEHIQAHVSDREGFMAMTNLAIAERLEALVDAQKPRWVEFEGIEGDAFVFVDASTVAAVDNMEEHGKCTGVNIETGNTTFTVKGTLAEVMDKIRGDK